MEEASKKNIPKHVGIILDGNRRWAKERHLPTLEGHTKGIEKMRHVPHWFFSRGVEILSMFAFSAENWSRSRDEVNYLMKLFKQAIDDEIESAAQRGYRIVVSGRIDELPGDLPESILAMMQATQTSAKGILNICLNYGGRQEIVDAFRKMAKNGVSPEQIHEGMIGKYLYNSDILTDPDIIVRTSGETRLSGFMLWRSAHSELLFLRKHWPEFEELDAISVIEEYGRRKRRMGGD